MAGKEKIDPSGENDRLKAAEKAKLPVVGLGIEPEGCAAQVISILPERTQRWLYKVAQERSGVGDSSSKTSDGDQAENGSNTAEVVFMASDITDAPDAAYVPTEEEVAAEKAREAEQAAIEERRLKQEEERQVRLRMEKEKKAAEEAYKEGLLRAHPELTGRPELEYIEGLMERAADKTPQSEDEFRKWLCEAIDQQRVFARAIVLGEGLPQLRNYVADIGTLEKGPLQVIIGESKYGESPLKIVKLTGIDKSPNPKVTSLEAKVSSDEYIARLLGATEQALLKKGDMQSLSELGVLPGERVTAYMQHIVRNVIALNSGNLAWLRQEVVHRNIKALNKAFGTAQSTATEMGFDDDLNPQQVADYRIIKAEAERVLGALNKRRTPSSLKTLSSAYMIEDETYGVTRPQWGNYQENEDRYSKNLRERKVFEDIARQQFADLHGFELPPLSK